VSARVQHIFSLSLPGIPQTQVIRELPYHQALKVWGDKIGLAYFLNHNPFSMKKLTIAIILNGIALLGFSQDSAKIASIKTLLEVTGSGKLGVQAVQNMIASYKQNLPSVPEEFWNEFMKEVNTDVLTSMVIPIYDKYYSLEELNAIIAFYQTPIGKKVISTLPQIMQESMQAGQSWGKEVGEKAFNKLKEQGFIKD
jgi:hypothetical protein